MRRLLLILLGGAALIVCAQKAWRGRLQHVSDKSSSAESHRMVPADSGAVSVSGFEKTLHSTIESFFITNNTDSTLHQVYINLAYNDTDNRQLHRRSELITVNIPPHETRRIEIKSFDRQATFYYYLSAAPRNGTTATPFKVSVTVDSLI